MPRQPQLKVVREKEGNTQKRPITPSVRLPAEAPAEPDWLEPFPIPKLGTKPGRQPTKPRKPKPGSEDLAFETYKVEMLGWQIERLEWLTARHAYQEATRLRAEAKRCREIAHRAWVEIVPKLAGQQILASVDRGALREHCVLMARIDQAERDLTTNGTLLPGERGATRNPAAMTVNQCRAQDRAYLQAFGLTPLDRDKLNRPEAESSDGLFDA